MKFTSTDLLSRLVAFDTTSRNSNLALIEWVAGHLADFGIDVHLTVDDAGTKANLFATIGPADRGGVCLHGHTDVVPVDGQPWTTDPFRLTERDGLLFGRGTSDMKAWAACALAAIPAWLGRGLRTPIHLALSYDEEIGCLGAPRMIDAFGRSVPKPLVTIVGEPSLMAPITAHKGCMALETAITGQDAHSSLPHLGVSAATAAAEMVSELHGIAQEWIALPGPKGMVPSGPTTNVGLLRAGVACNLIARDARLLWEIRFRAGDEPEALLHDALARIQARLRRTFGERFGVLRLDTRVLASVTAFDAGAGSVAERLVRRLGAQGEPRGVPYGAEAGQYAAAGISTVICGPGSIEQAHQPDEFIAASQLAACDAFLARLGVWASEERLEPQGTPACAEA